MNCPSCHHPNPGSARFCGECGSSLALEQPCPACGQDNPVGQRFCHSCGHRVEEEAAPPLAPQPATPAGERKQVTVVFCDIQGSMQLAGSVDPEVWRDVMNRFFSLFCEEVQRLDGTVDKFTGDGAMALFGAPIAQEDHAARACHAALALSQSVDAFAEQIRHEHGLPIAVRVGLNSGEVVAGGVGSDEAGAYTAIGNTVGLAARMESVAEPGVPCLTADTAALITGLFELKDRGDLPVKGFPDGIHAFGLKRALASGTRLEASRGGSNLVGRDSELATLEVALSRAAESGQVVGVVAEAGLGKSRLCAEFADRCRERGIEVTEGRGTAHGRKTPLVPVIEILRSWFGVQEDDDPREAQRLIAERLLELDGRFAEALPVVYDFLGVPAPELQAPRDTPEARQRTLFGVVRHIVEARASEGPAVLLVEDLHWLDPGSDSFLEALVESLPGSRTLLVVNFRPEYRAAWTSRSYYQQLPLAPLSAASVENLLSSLAGDDPSLDGLAELLGERTAGNPFFVEEVVQTLIENGTLAGEPGDLKLTRSVEAIEIPATVQAVLAARIDRLAERDKAVLQTAAVIGREFTEPVLSAVTGLPSEQLAEALAVLRSAELVYERQAISSDRELAFKHPLTAEVAYRSQLSDRRARVHAAVADAIETLYADNLDQRAALVADHREEAGQILDAARMNARAATWAGANHPVDALRHWRRVRSMLSDQPSSPEADGLQLTACMWTLSVGWRLGLDSEELDEVEGQGLSLAAEQPHALAAVYAAAGIARGMSGDVRSALTRSQESERLGIELGNLELQYVGGLSYWQMLSGDLEETLAAVESGATLIADQWELGRATVGFSMPIWNAWFRGQVLMWLGRLAEARAALEGAIVLAREHDDPECLGWAHMNLSMVPRFIGEVADELEHAERSRAVAEASGSAFSRATQMAFFSLALIGRGEWDAALDAAQQSVEILRSAGTGLQYEANYLGLVAEALIGAGSYEAALAPAREAIEVAAQRGTPMFDPQCRLQLGRALVLAGDIANGERELARALEGAERVAPVFVPHTHEALAEVAVARGDLGEERRRLELARDLYAQQGASGHERRLARRLEADPAAR